MSYSSYSNRRPRTQKGKKAQPSRQTRTTAKLEEPHFVVCGVTLSSNEDDDSFHETKKLKSDGIHKSSEKLDGNSLNKEQPNIQECAASNAVSMDLPGIDAEERLGSNDFLHWNGVAGLKEPFFPIHCKSVRIGSYRFTPVGQVLFSSKGIMLQAPVFHNHNESSEKSAVWVNVAIPTQQLMKVDAHFSQQLKVIFLNCLPSLCRQLSSKLGLPKSGPYWDSASEDESKKRLTLFPGNLNYATKNAIKKVIVPRGVYHEINHAEANRLLVFSASPEVRDALNRLHAGTSVPAETSVSSIDSPDVIGDKEDAIKDLPIDAEEKIGSNEFLRWKEGGLKRPFVAVNCRFVRIGSYKFIPVGQVLFSSKGIMLQAPVFHNHNESSEKSAVWVNVAIPTQQLMKVDAHFSQQLKVIFLNCLPKFCRQLSSKLGLTKSGPYWDSASEDESQQRLILLLVNLEYAAKNAIRQVFFPQGVYDEIDHAEANRLLVFSAPPEVRDALNRLRAGTSVSAERSVLTTVTMVAQKTLPKSK